MHLRRRRVVRASIVAACAWLAASTRAQRPLDLPSGPGAPRPMPAAREPAQPLRFAQFVGLLFAVVGVAGFIFAVPLVGVIATAFALFAAFLNAAFGICLGCQVYPLITRIRHA